MSGSHPRSDGDTLDFDKIYFDMDGVLADFNKGVMDMCQIYAGDQEGPDRKELDDRMFAAIAATPHFYLKLEPVDGMLDILKELISEYGNKVEILTGIPKPERNVVTAAEDKVEWVRKLVSDDIMVNTVLRREKMQFAKGPETILVDDMKKNIDEWKEAGGTGIRFTGAEDLRRTLGEMKIL